MTLGGQGVHGYRHSESTKLKVSECSKHYWDNLKENYPEKYAVICEKRSKNMKGLKKSEEAKKSSSKAAKKRFENNPGTFKGKHHSEESKNKISEANGCRVAMIDINSGDILNIFQSANKAGEYLISEGKTTNKYANARIFEICKGNGKTAYGYKWEKIN